MHKFNEMVLIAKSEYEMLTRSAKPTESVTDAAMKQAQMKCDEILFAEDCPDDVKTAMYQSAMKSLLVKRKQLGNEVRGSEAKVLKVEMAGRNLDEKIYQSVPQKFKARARSLWAILSGNESSIRVYDNGEVEISGRLIPASNIVDLIQHTVRDSQSASEPTGWKEFIDLLRQKDLNVPLTAVGKFARKQILQHTADGADRVRNEQSPIKGLGSECAWLRLNKGRRNAIITRMKNRKILSKV